jgi:predicted nucleotidyltransferase
MNISDSEEFSAGKKFAEEVKAQIDNLAEVFLFGSTVRNQRTPDSDIDIAVVSDKLDGFLSDRDISLLSCISYKISTDIEFHTFNKSQWNFGSNFINEIKKTGVRIS